MTVDMVAMTREEAYTRLTSLALDCGYATWLEVRDALVDEDTLRGTLVRTEFELLRFLPGGKL